MCKREKGEEGGGRAPAKDGEARTGCCGCGKKRKERDRPKRDDSDSAAQPKRGCCTCLCCRGRKERKPKAPKVNSKEKCVSCCKKFTAFLFSHVGLTCLVVAYSVLGGFIFMILEKPFEQRERGLAGNLRRTVVSKLWNWTESLNILREKQWKAEVEKELKQFQKDIVAAVKNFGWDGSDEKKEVGYQWNFAGALLYAVTVITTIGYGHIAPKTKWGRLITIGYAIIGIPLTMLCLANLGNFLANCFRVVYKKILCRLCFYCEKRQKQKQLTRTQLPPPYTKHEGDILELHNSGSAGYPMNERFSSDVVVYTMEDNDDNSGADQVPIPIVATLLIMAAYIFGGAMLFSLWEKDWDYLVGSYFCFVTLSTIGFGDFVPGTSPDSWGNQSKRVLCTLYLLFGLALLAMSFELMQEKVRHTCTRIGICLGIIESDKDE